MVVDAHELFRHLNFFLDQSEQQLTAGDVYNFFMHREEDIVNLISQKGLLCFPIIKDFHAFQPLLLIYLLTSHHTCLRLPATTENEAHWVYRSSINSMYDDIGHAFKSTLNFGSRVIFEEIVRDAQILIQQGVLSLVPTNTIEDYKSYGAPKKIDYENILLEKVNHQPMLSTDSPCIGNIVMPLICGANTSDLLKFIVDEWDTFVRCREYLIYASLELYESSSGEISKIKFNKIKNDIIDDGIHVINSRMYKLKRKGLIQATGGILGSVSLVLTNFMFSGSVHFLNSALATSILGVNAIVNYIEYQDNIRILQDNRLYFLWQLRKTLICNAKDDKNS